MEYTSDWSVTEGEQWLVAGHDWGRRSRGATVRLAGLGEVVRGRACDQTRLCLESVLEPGNFLVGRPAGRMVWQRMASTAECGYVRPSYLTSLSVSLSTIISVLRLLYRHPDDGQQHLHQVPAGPRPSHWQETNSADCLRPVPHLVLGGELLVQS